MWIAALALDWLLNDRAACDIARTCFDIEYKNHQAHPQGLDKQIDNKTRKPHKRLIMIPHRNEDLSQPSSFERATSNTETASNHNELDYPGDSVPLADLETMESQLFDLEFPVLMDLGQPENESLSHDQDTVMTDAFNATDRITTADSSLSMEIQNTINMDPSWPQLSDQDWLLQNLEMDLASLATEFLIDPTSSLAGDLTWQQFNQNGVETLQAQEYHPSYSDFHAPSAPDQFEPGIMPAVPDQTRFTSHAMFPQVPTTQTELVQHQQDVYDQGQSHNARSLLNDMRTDLLASGPVIQQRSLPPIRRGGRSGRMSSPEAREQYMARQNGVCARCWWLNKKCQGGVPCETCLNIRQPRRWKTPCTKPQFLEFIKAGAFFFSNHFDSPLCIPPVSQFELITTPSGTDISKHPRLARLDIDQATAILGFLHYYSTTDIRISNYTLALKPSFQWTRWGVTLKNPSLLLYDSFRLMYFPNGTYQPPSTDSINEVHSKIFQKYPFNLAPELRQGASKLPMLPSVSALALHCYTPRLFVDALGKPVKLDDSQNHVAANAMCFASWFCHFHDQLYLFQILHDTIRQCRKDSEKRTTFIQSVLFVLMVSRNEREHNSFELERNDSLTSADMAEYLDRKQRVRTALWIYASICLDHLPSWDYFWSHLPKSLAIFRGDTTEQLRESLKSLDLYLDWSTSTYFNKLRTDLSHAPFHSNERRSDGSLKPNLGLTSGRKWREVLASTLRQRNQACPPIYHFNDVLEHHLQDDLKRIFTPRSPAECDEAALVLFGDLISMANLPDICSDSYFRVTGRFSPARLSLALSLFKFQHRAPGICPYQCMTQIDSTGCDKSRDSISYGAQGVKFHHEQSKYPSQDLALCLRQSSRFSELANLLGDVAYFMRGEYTPLFHAGLPRIIIGGDRDEFGWLCRILLPSSWLKSCCKSLDGLYQALLQVADPNSQVERARSFQRLLRRKARGAFGNLIHEISKPSREKKRLALRLWFKFSSCYEILLETYRMSEYPQDQLRRLRFHVADAAERAFFGQLVISDDSNQSKQFDEMLEWAKSHFMIDFIEQMTQLDVEDLDSKAAICEAKLSKIAATMNKWFLKFGNAAVDDGSMDIELQEVLINFLLD